MRLALTHGFVEDMVGHRTRAVQEPPGCWNAGEDQSLEGYYSASRALDRAGVYLQVLAPRGWFITGIGGLIPAFVSGGQPIPRLAIGIGGVLLAYQAFKHLAEGLERLLAAAVAWERIQPFWRAASRPEPLGHPQYAARGAANVDPHPERAPEESFYGGPLLDVHKISCFARPLVPSRSCAAWVFGSTRASASSSPAPQAAASPHWEWCSPACAHPTAVSACLRAWTARPWAQSAGANASSSCPNFTKTISSRGPWPSISSWAGVGCRVSVIWTRQRRSAATSASRPSWSACRRGLQQWVGETGWQLSHGERDRVYIARALLQGAELMILDESLAALDPHTLGQVLDRVLRRAPALLLIAHP